MDAFEGQVQLNDLPVELHLAILKKLDPRSLSNMALTSKHFYSLTRDSSICKYVNVNLYRGMYKSEAYGFVLQRLQQLKALYLQNCPFVNNILLDKIVSCSKLQYLSLLNCCNITNYEFTGLENLKNLRGLALNHDDFGIYAICRLISNNRELRRLWIDGDGHSIYHNIRPRIWELNVGMLLDCITKNCQKIEYITCPGFLRSTSISSIYQLKLCKKLRTLHFRRCSDLDEMIILSFICGALEREGYTTAMCMDEDRLKPHKLESGIPGLEFDMSALLSVRSGQFGDTDYHLTRAAVVFTPSKSMSESEEDLYLDQLYALYPQFAHSF